MSDTKTTVEPEAKNDEKKKDRRDDRAEVRFENSMPIEEAVSYFEAIVQALKKGTIHLKQGENSLTLSPMAQLNVEVKASRKKDKEKISFGISWRSVTESDLTITSE